jgi:hypothetical protein
LLKISNLGASWGFIARFTDPEGRQLDDLKYSVKKE